MNQENKLPKEVRQAGIRFSGTREATEHRRGGPEQQAGVKKLLGNSPVFTNLMDAVKQAMKDRKEENWSHVMASWDEGDQRYWVIRDHDPNYKFICFSGLRGVVPAALVDVAWKALTGGTDTLEEV